MGDAPGDHYLVEVGGRRFRIAGAAMDDVRERMVRAVRAAGGFITLGSGDGSRDVLISPGLPVTIQRRSDPAGVPQGEAAGASIMPSIVAPGDQFDDGGI
jgi:hypothetical protein